jgi:hypothetical protein
MVMAAAENVGGEGIVVRATARLRRGGQLRHWRLAGVETRLMLLWASISLASAQSAKIFILRMFPSQDLHRCGKVTA